MYPRLWWKEARTFWPFWVTLGVVAAGVQWFSLWAELPEARSGLLITVGLFWSMLYAFAVGAATFAAERETNTQVFLDTLPVGRRMLWTSKVSFALATTLGMSLALTALGVLGTANRAQFAIEMNVQAFGITLIEGVAWSLLWSVVLNSALQSAVLGLLTVGLLDMLLVMNVDLRDPAVLAPRAAIRLVLAGGALLVSWVVFTRRPRPGRSGQVREAIARDIEDRPIGLPWLATQFGRLAWETLRESRGTWLLLGGVGIASPLVIWFDDAYTGSAVLWASVMVMFASLLAGVSVFGPANRARSYRFLVYHGVRPGMIWASRVLVWGLVVAVLLAIPLTLFVLLSMGSETSPLNGSEVLSIGCMIIDAFVVGLFCGQVLQRSITAWVAACLAYALLVFLQNALAGAQMIPPESQAIFPVLVLIISFAWAGDWMNDLRGAARWLRLGAMVGAALALLVSSYIGYRVWSVPDIGAPFPTHSTASATSAGAVAPDQDAAPDYAEIVSEYGYGALQVKSGSLYLGLIGSLQRAAEKPVARFTRPDLLDSPIDRLIPELESIVGIVGSVRDERRVRGDLAGAWDDLRAVFRLSAQISQSGAFDETSIALRIRSTALPWAMEWAADPRQTTAQLRSALADFRALPRCASVSDCLEVEYALVERTFRRAERDPYVLLTGTLGKSEKTRGMRVLLPVLLAPSWERERARRVVNLLFAHELQLARLEPWERTAKYEYPSVSLIDLHWTQGKTARLIPASDLAWYLGSSTPLVQRLWTASAAVMQVHDQELLLGRAFEQVVALRIWQLEHGDYPETLEALVPGLFLVPGLPPDPYSGKPFRYRPSHGQKVLPLGLGNFSNFWNAPLDVIESWAQPTVPGQWLLYSVGMNGSDDDARADLDVVFPLPVAADRTKDPAGQRKADGEAVAP